MGSLSSVRPFGIVLLYRREAGNGTRSPFCHVDARIAFGSASQL